MRFFFIIILIPFWGSCQNKERSELLIDKNKKFEIKNEGKIINISFGNPTHSRLDTIRAELAVNNDPVREIHFTNAKLQDSLLTISINSTTTAYYQVYTIEIKDRKCKVNYLFKPSGPDFESTVTPTEYKVVLNTEDLSIGKEVRGYTEFKGKCKGDGCYGEEEFLIKGNFKFKILRL